jgi:acetyl-CoA C-acetyltransferase
MGDDSIPVLIGGGQLTRREIEPEAALAADADPIGMMTEAARSAARDAGMGDRLLAELDSLAVVNVIAWPYHNAPRLLAEGLGARPREELYTTVGGNTPQWLVNRTATRIASGEVRLALLAGGEAVHALLRARRTGKPVAWTSGGEGNPQTIGDPRAGTNRDEEAHGLVMPTQIYPLFENALRAHHGLSLTAHRTRLGQLASHLSAVAAGNPHAWFRTARSAQEIATVTGENRIIGFPYPKYMNAIIDVDQAAAVLMTSAGNARRLGIDRSRWVYLCGAADAHDLWFVTERADYVSSPALRAAGRAALEAAELTIDAIDYLDLYSCFPCALEIGRTALGIAEDDPRALTVTGGLPYAGGPGNNYSMHAVATMMDRLRATPGTRGLVSALGWYLTKHSVGVYGTEPGPRSGASFRTAEVDQAALDRAAHPALAHEAEGRASIETFTVLHERDGAPARGIVIGRLADGRRFVAHTPSDRSVLEGLESAEAVGRPGSVAHADGVNRFSPL